MNGLRSDQTEDHSENDQIHEGARKVNAVESEIRDFIRNDVAYLRRPAPPALNGNMSPEAAVANVNSLIQRVAGGSLAEIDRLVNELDSLRDMLHCEGQRVQREIAGYAQLSQTAMKSTRIIAENMAQWRKSLHLPGDEATAESHDQPAGGETHPQAAEA